MCSSTKYGQAQRCENPLGSRLQTVNKDNNNTQFAFFNIAIIRDSLTAGITRRMARYHQVFPLDRVAYTLVGCGTPQLLSPDTLRGQNGCASSYYSTRGTLFFVASCFPSACLKENPSLVETVEATGMSWFMLMPGMPSRIYSVAASITAESLPPTAHKRLDGDDSLTKASLLTVTA